MEKQNRTQTDNFTDLLKKIKDSDYTGLDTHWSHDFYRGDLFQNTVSRAYCLSLLAISREEIESVLPKTISNADDEAACILDIIDSIRMSKEREKRIWKILKEKYGVHFLNLPGNELYFQNYGKSHEECHERIIRGNLRFDHERLHSLEMTVTYLSPQTDQESNGLVKVRAFYETTGKLPTIAGISYGLRPDINRSTQRFSRSSKSMDSVRKKFKTEVEKEIKKVRTASKKFHNPQFVEKCETEIQRLEGIENILNDGLVSDYFISESAYQESATFVRGNIKPGSFIDYDVPGMMKARSNLEEPNANSYNTATNFAFFDLKDFSDNGLELARKIIGKYFIK